MRPVLTAVQAPTSCCTAAATASPEGLTVYLAEHIAGATLVELPGEDNLIYIGNSDADLDEIEEFLTGARHAPGPTGSSRRCCSRTSSRPTQHAAAGRPKWRDLLDAHDRTIRRQNEFRGQEVNTAGDGFLATFDGPGRAIQARVRDPGRRSGARHRGTGGPTPARSSSEATTSPAWLSTSEPAPTSRRGGGSSVLHGQGPRRRVGHRVPRSRRAPTQGRARDVEIVLSRELTARRNVPMPAAGTAARSANQGHSPYSGGPGASLGALSFARGGTSRVARSDLPIRAATMRTERPDRTASDRRLPPRT